MIAAINLRVDVRRVLVVDDNQDAAGRRVADRCVFASVWVRGDGRLGAGSTRRSGAGRGKLGVIPGAIQLS